MTSLKDMPDPAAQVIEAERQWLSAHLKLDFVLLDRLMADEFLQVNDRGELLSKQQVLASFKSGNRYWQEANGGEYKVQVYNEVAVICGCWQAKGVNTGQSFDYAARYVSVWVYRDKRWQMVSDQSTTITDEMRNASA